MEPNFIQRILEICLLDGSLSNWKLKTETLMEAICETAIAALEAQLAKARQVKQDVAGAPDLRKVVSQRFQEKRR